MHPSVGAPPASALSPSRTAAPVPRVDARLLESWNARVLHRREDAGLLLWEIALPPGFRCPPHEHELPFFCVLLEGSLENTYRRGPIAYRRFLNVFHPAGTVHSSLAGPEGARILTLEARQAWLERLEGRARMPAVPSLVTAADAVAASRRLLAELREPLPCSELVVEGIALELLAAAARSRDEQDAGGLAPRWLVQLLEQLHEELERPPSLRDLAHELGLPAARLSAIFRRHTGRTLGAYRRELQVEWVRRRLADRRHADEPLASVALAAGFCDQAHCTRIFKAATGWTPARFRARALGYPAS
ncbi:MAG TPA: AraC family transcriptional regulator [Thermoanaerobaculia bacterium]|jgi:AraC family transcriptional regulator|nr:AraC family transcriptional regulator [Thermoanaerobaculia bacterium]